jgi:hypothetical protein
MSITGIKAPGARLVCFELDPRTALDVWFHLAASLHTEETTVHSRIVVASLLPPLRRAIVTTGIASGEALDALHAHLMRKPAPDALDQAIRASFT